MNERDAFLRGIAANLYDDAPRLAFADWLDEQGGKANAARAEFIRVQCELEPMRDRYEIPRAAELHAREDELLSEHRGSWLKKLPKWPHFGDAVTVDFRRGFVDTLALPVEYLLEYGKAVRRDFPLLRRIALFRVNGWGDRLAGCPHLQGLRELELACWYSDADAEAVAASPRLSDLEVLQLWLGRREDGARDDALCKLMARSKAWPRLRELRLLDPDPAGANRTPPLVKIVNRTAKRPIGRGFAGFADHYALASVVAGRYLSGRLTDGRAAFVNPTGWGNDPVLVVVFDSEGYPVEELEVPLPTDFPDRTAGGRAANRQLIQQHLSRTIGFTPAFIRVKGLPSAGGRVTAYRGFFDDTERIGLADPPDEDPEDMYPDGGIGERIYDLIRRGLFILDDGNDIWCGKNGKDAL